MSTGEWHPLYQTYYLAEKKTESKFLIRPTLTGYIPMGKKHKGLSVTIGYNIVTGASNLSGLLFGVGFFI